VDVSGHLRRLRRRYRARPIDSILELTAVGLTVWILVGPFTVVRYPPITDLPMHAAVTSAFRHWFDPAWHFRDQFELQPFRVPLLTMYSLGAVFALVMPIGPAVKLASIAMLATLPVGLAVYCRGMKKSPLLGVAAAGLAWGPLTQWGFLSFIGALGLTLLGVGLALHVVERPTRARVAGLAIVSVLVFFTHVSRFPFYVAAVAIAVIATTEAWRPARAVLLALAPTLAVFVAWWFLLRPASLQGSFEPGWHPDRWRRVVSDLSRGFQGSGEYDNFRMQVALVAFVAIYCPVASLVVRLRSRRRPALRVRLRVVRRALGALAIAAMFAGLYFWMPMNVGIWSYVFPREATAAALCALALLPQLPKHPWVRAPALTALLVAASLPMQFVADRYATFERQTAAFQHLVAELPMAPKLGYLVVDPGDSEAIFRPLVHLPAWVQAEKGGWLSFHFATWDSLPIRFRTDPGADVAPPTPPDFEWHPSMFDVATRGKYFDWFLVHAGTSPEALLAPDPALHLLRHEGAWWLYRREPLR
jgi:hypothetical protein